MDEHHHILEKLGFSSSEAKVYLSLIRYSSCTIQVLAKCTNIHRRNIYDVINRLIEKGMVCEIVTSGGNLYKAFDPEKIESIYNQKMKEIKSILPDLQGIYNRSNSGNSQNEVVIFRGLEGYKNYMRMILSARKTIYSLGTKGDWFDSRLNNFSADFFKEKARLGIESKLLIDYEYSKIFNPGKHLLAEYKILPESYSTDSTIDIFDDRVVIFSVVKDNIVDMYSDILMIQDSHLALNFIKWHGLIWDLLG
jgi:sugar-specific transcriptional regulator TrmB